MSQTTATIAHVDTINGSASAPDGTFSMLPHRQFPTDKRFVR